MTATGFAAPTRHGSEVVSVEGVLDGTPVISGTRIPAVVILLSHKAGVRLDYLREDYPSLTEEGLAAVLRWSATDSGKDWLHANAGI